ncbi:TPA: pilus assembly protein PilW [Neisseria gonorrhoeae]
MKRKMLNVPKGGYDGMKGFTIVEFLVAGLLSVIVLIAVVSSYFTSRKLNDAANERLAEQQDLRNAATLIVRDARMAGSFGCFNMSEHIGNDVVFNVAQKNALFSLKRNSTNSTNKLIPITESPNINYQNFFQVSSALIFQYGIDDVDASADTTVVSSCAAISKPGKQIPTLEDAKKELKIQNSDKEQNGNIADKEQNGNIARQRHVVNAYAVGKIAGEEGLFRFQLNEKGEWGNPQLLAKKIKRMRVRYIYVSGCPEDEDAGKEEQFKYTDKFDSSVTPAGVEVLLDSGSDAKIAASSDNIIYAYRINATIRGGNVCANRTL